jgi:hypothetical protein
VSYQVLKSLVAVLSGEPLWASHTEPNDSNEGVSCPSASGGRFADRECRDGVEGGRDRRRMPPRDFTLIYVSHV